jgi:hypothetical protein
MKLDTDRVVSISAMIAALGSLFIIVYQTHLMRQAQNAAALPYLQIALSSNDQGVFINLANVGVGPALIEKVRVHDKSGFTDGDAYDYYVAHKPEAAKEGALSIDRVIPGRLIPAGAGVQMLGMGAEHRGVMLSGLLTTFEVADIPNTWYENLGVPRGGDRKAVIEITYTSVYGDRWRVTSDRVVPERL